jgi:hypothetical protein
MDPVKVNSYAINTEKKPSSIYIILSYIILCCVILSYLILYCINIFLYDRTQLQLLTWTFLSPPSFWFEDFIHLHTSSYIFIRMSLRGEYFCERLFRFNGRRKRGQTLFVDTLISQKSGWSTALQNSVLVRKSRCRSQDCWFSCWSFLAALFVDCLCKS